MKAPLKKLCLTLGVIATLSMAPYTHAQTGQVLLDLSTGVSNGSSSPIAYGSPDDTWLIKRGPLKPALTTYVCSNLNGAWDVNSCARWITPKLASDGIQPDGNAAAGNYIYQTAFNLSTTCFPWAKVNFSYLGGDDNIILFTLNGNDYPLSPATVNDFSSLTQNVSFNLDPSQFVVGPNVISIWTTNNVGPNGLFVCGNVTVGYCTFSSGPVSGTGLFLEGPQTFSVYPNPSTGKFVLTLEEATEGSVEIVDMLGRKIQGLRLNPAMTTYSVDLSGFPKGMYTVMLHTGKAVQIRKITLK